MIETTPSELVLNPREALSIEIKSWFDPKSAEGEAKIARAAIALRNLGGGYMLIGFTNSPHAPATKNRPMDPRITFHHDVVQTIVSKFTSEPFEIRVEFPIRDELEYPVLVVPSGIRTPIAAKSDLADPQNPKKKLISAGDVFVRTLRSNNAPSTAKAGWGDWPNLMETCFDNREADIGRFLRRHLAGVDGGVGLIKAIQQALAQPKPEVGRDAILQTLLNDGRRRYQSAMQTNHVDLPLFGTWEVGLIAEGSVPAHRATADFLQLLSASNPSLTGWPVWLNLKGMSKEHSKTYVNEGAWEAWFAEFDFGNRCQMDFWRLDPTAQFYLIRALKDDITYFNGKRHPIEMLDIRLVILRTAEAIAVGMAFFRAMKCDEATTVAHFTFRWSKLQGRKLVSWTDLTIDIWNLYIAHQDEVITRVGVPLDAPPSTLADFVHTATADLFAAFDGYEVPRPFTEGLVKRLLDRRLY